MRIRRPLRKWIFALLLPPMLCSCRPHATPPPSTASSAADRTTLIDPAPSSFFDQVEAVRNGQSDRIHVVQQPVTDDDLKHLVPLHHLRELLLDEGRITDAGAAHLRQLPELQHLRLRHSPLHDEGLRILAELPHLRVINLPHGQFTDAGMKHLRRASSLEQLRLGSPHVTDKGLAEVSRIATLRWLHLIDIPITDAGLQCLWEIPALESFYIDGAQVTDAGLVALFEARPDLHVHRDQSHLDRDPQKHQH